jgi:predicted acyl esterase
LVDAPAHPSGLDSLRYRAGVGTAVPVWWGDATGDMAGDDGGSLVYDSPVLQDTLEMIGFPRIRLRVTAPVTIANWTVRLEDVSPTGEVALVTGALVSGPQRLSRLAPTALVPGEPTDLSSGLHFSSGLRCPTRSSRWPGRRPSR